MKRMNLFTALALMSMAMFATTGCDKEDEQAAIADVIGAPAKEGYIHVSTLPDSVQAWFAENRTNKRGNTPPHLTWTFYHEVLNGSSRFFNNGATVTYNYNWGDVWHEKLIWNWYYLRPFYTAPDGKDYWWLECFDASQAPDCRSGSANYQINLVSSPSYDTDAAGISNSQSGKTQFKLLCPWSGVLPTSQNFMKVRRFNGGKSQFGSGWGDTANCW